MRRSKCIARRGGVQARDYVVARLEEDCSRRRIAVWDNSYAAEMAAQLCVSVECRGLGERMLTTKLEFVNLVLVCHHTHVGVLGLVVVDRGREAPRSVPSLRKDWVCRICLSKFENSTCVYMYSEFCNLHMGIQNKPYIAHILNIRIILSWILVLRKVLAGQKTVCKTIDSQARIRATFLCAFAPRDDYLF